MIRTQDLIDLFLAITLPHFEGFDDVPQNGFQLFLFSGNGFLAAIFTKVIFDDFIVVRVHVHIGNGSGHFLL